MKKLGINLAFTWVLLENSSLKLQNYWFHGHSKTLKNRTSRKNTNNQGQTNTKFCVSRTLFSLNDNRMTHDFFFSWIILNCKKRYNPHYSDSIKPKLKYFDNGQQEFKERRYNDNGHG